MTKRTYDIRVRNAVARSGDADLFPELEIPRPTALEWIRLGIKEVVTHPSFEWSHDTLVEKIASLEKSLEAEKAKNQLVKCSLEVLSFRMQYVRVAAGELKEKLLQTITNATLHVPLKECLETIGLTAARYHSWIKRQVKCLLPDQSTCPKLSPTKITSKETLAIKELVTAKEYAHFSINSLAMFARRQQMVFASATAWYRIVREFNLRRPGVRVYPPKPKIGIRASEPNQIWHVDVSVFRIMNGAKVYIQAIIDNASRYVLAWEVTQTYGGASTKALIEKALEVANRVSAKVVVPNLFADDGTENQNKDVDSLVKAGKIIRTIAQIDVEFSNSMIEAVCRAVAEYLTDHNNRIPHYALGGAVPLEVFSGTWTQKSQLLLAEASTTATLQRIEFNRTQKCGLCPA
ncbi:MAG: transposase [Burkholderiales bacterium]|nr:MAG: transposase [Burkholderiales bacterium]